MKTAAAAAALLLASAAHAATPVYRCGVEGKDYSQQPCSDGVALSIDDGRNAAQRDASAQAVARQRRLADELARDRERREKALHAPATSLSAAATASPSKPGASQPRPTRRPSPPARAASGSASQPFTAIVPGSGKRTPASTSGR